MSNYQLVHKVLYGVEPHQTIALAKFVDQENIGGIQFYIGLINMNVESVENADVNQLLGTGVPIAADSLNMFFGKSNYDEHDLLGDDEDQISIRLA